MTFFRRLFPAFFAIGFVASSLDAAVLPDRLRCEYRIDPAGIGETHPRLGWDLQAADGDRGVRQTAYRVLVSSSPELLAQEHGDLWDSGKVGSDQMQQLVYAGQPLASQEHCWWKVSVWDEHDHPSAWSTPATWSMGLLTAGEWRAQWIGLDTPPPKDGSTIDAETRARFQKNAWAYTNLPISRDTPSRVFVRRTITLPMDRQLTRATLAFTPDQVCTITVNGKSAGTVTRWEQVAPVDITALLSPGENVVGLEVTQRDGYPPALLGELQLRYERDDPQVLPIDASWKFSPTAAADWERHPFDDHEWQPLVVDPKRRNPWEGPPQNASHFLPPAPMLRKSFTLAKPVRRATVYSTALGLYELQLNGARVGRDYFSPGWTDYHARVQYQTYDVTAQLRGGENVIGALLGDGWYASALAYTGRRNYYGGYPRLLVQLELEYADGSHDVIVSDGTWKAADGAIRHADLLQGCLYDAQLASDNWLRPGFDDSHWSAAATGLRMLDEKKAPPAFVVEASSAEPVHITQELPARTVTEPRPGAYTFDLGQNMVGWVRLKVQGRAGQKIMVRHGEVLNPNGTLYTSNLRGASATDVYYLRGGAVETLQPFFTFHGFRYVEVTGLEAKPELGAVTGIVLHSDLERTGDFECSNPLVNQLYQNAIWSQRGNYLDVPTDCPQRDERAGWTGDAQFFFPTGAYNFGIASFFSRWLVTLTQDGQLPEGSYANVAPVFGTPWTSTGWGDAALVCTHLLYRYYGDTRVIERNFDSMGRYMAWLGTHAKDGIVTMRSLGDHLNLGGGAKVEVINTAYYAYLAGIMAEMAEAIGRHEDAQRYAALHDTVKAAFQRAFVQPDGSILQSSQTGYALAFTMDLLPDEMKAKAADQFVEEIRKRDWHLATGFIGTPRLLPALHLAGRDDVAYRVLLQDTYPSWLFPVKNGATTIWERWDGWTQEKGFQSISMNSFNHYSFGSVGEYLYRNVAGIDADGPGFRQIVINPSPAEGLTWARASYQSISGRITSAWNTTDGKFELAVEIPPNTQATVEVPAKNAGDVRESGKTIDQTAGVTFVKLENSRAIFHVGSGKYQFTSTP